MPRAGGVWFCIATESAVGNAFGVSLANDFRKSRSHCATVSKSYGQLPVSASIEDHAEEGARMAISSNFFCMMPRVRISNQPLHHNTIPEPISDEDHFA